MALWAVLGVLCGLVGSAVVGVVSAVSAWRNRLTRVALGLPLQRRRRLLVCALFSIVVSHIGLYISSADGTSCMLCAGRLCVSFANLR
jgi:hypothetical protein